VSYFRVAGRKVAMQKHEKVTIWRVFAWRLFAFSPRKHDNTKWHKSATIVLRYIYIYLFIVGWNSSIHIGATSWCNRPNSNILFVRTLFSIFILRIFNSTQLPRAFAKISFEWPRDEINRDMIYSCKNNTVAIMWQFYVSFTVSYPTIH